MSANRIEKLIEVTIRVDDRGAVDFEFYEPETGEFDRLAITVSKLEQEKTSIADEILSWVSLMQDEVEEILKVG